MTCKTIPEIQAMFVPQAARRMVMLSSIYFYNSDLIPATVSYMHALIEYHVHAINSFRRDAPPGATIGQMMYLDKTTIEKTRPLDEKQLVLKSKLDDAIAREAVKYEPSP
jgi:hypothetical protein